MLRDHLLQERIGQLTDGFGRYVKAYDELASFNSRQLAAHRACRELRRQAGSVRAAVADERFVDSLRRMLIAWGIGRRASTLASETRFTEALREAVPDLETLEPLTIDAPQLPADIADRLWLVIDSLGVVENYARIVAGTKTLHHLLPDLIMPMDRRYTGTFFGLGAHEWQHPVYQRRAFRVMYSQLAAVAQRVQPQQYVTGAGWRTSRTKIIDNALIDFCKAEINGQSAAPRHAGNDISFDVEGYPPAKNEALSMLGVGHSHAPRVRLLLEQARAACQEQEFVPIKEGQVALDVVVRAAAHQPTWDATNYLGGIADVLENKSHRGVLAHLGELANVWLYRNDRQIKEVSYREVESSEVGFTVTIRAINYDPVRGR